MKLPGFKPPSNAEEDSLISVQVLREENLKKNKIIGVLLVALILMVIAIAGLTPLKKETAYAVQVNGKTGEVSVPKQEDSKPFEPTMDNVIFFAERWIKALYSIQPQRVTEDEALSLKELRGDAAIAKQKQFRKDDDTFKRVAQEPALVRDVVVESITPVSGSNNSIVANVVLTTSSRQGTVTERRLLTLYYELIAPKTLKDRREHPAGFYIVDFTIAAK